MTTSWEMALGRLAGSPRGADQAFQRHPVTRESDKNRFVLSAGGVNCPEVSREGRSRTMGENQRLTPGEA